MLSREQALAVARISLGTAQGLLAVETFTILGSIIDGSLAMPAFEWVPAPSTPLAVAYLALSVIGGAIIALGWHSALACVGLVVLNIATFVWDEQLYSNHRVLITLLLVYLACARADSRWAVRPSALPVRWGAVTLMLTQVSVCYLFASLSKINPLFLTGAPLSQWMWVPLPWWMYTVMAFGTVVVEAFVAVGLWIGRWRPLAVALGVALHVSILVTMLEGTVALVSFALACLGTYPLFMTRTAAPRISGPGAPVPPLSPEVS